MKVTGILLMTLLLMSCSDDRTTQATVTAKDGANGTSCSVAPEYSQDIFGEYQKTSMQQVGARISCTDGSFAIILNGEKGEQGIQGERGLTGATGQAGTSCSASRQPHDNKVKVQCGNQSPVYIYDGQDGEDGRDGRNGTNGTNGTSCSVTQLSNGARITCGNNVALVYNGINGTNGTNGTNGSSCSISNLSNGARITCGNTSQDIYDGEDGRDSALCDAIGIASYIKPCGAEFNNDEIFLRMTDGNILALYDGGANLDRLVLLAPGNYVTTDRNGNQTCNVRVDNNLNVTWSLSNNGGH